MLSFTETTVELDPAVKTRPMLTISQGASSGTLAPAPCSAKEESLQEPHSEENKLWRESVWLVWKPELLPALGFPDKTHYVGLAANPRIHTYTPCLGRDCLVTRLQVGHWHPAEPSRGALASTGVAAVLVLIPFQFREKYHGNAHSISGWITYCFYYVIYKMNLLHICPLSSEDLRDRRTHG